MATGLVKRALTAMHSNAGLGPLATAIVAVGLVSLCANAYAQDQGSQVGYNAKTLDDVNVTAGYIAPERLRAYAALQSVSVAPLGAGSPHTTFNVAAAATKADSHNPCPDTAGDPITMSSGNKVDDYVDFELPGEMGLKFERFYQSKWLPLNSPGGWTTNLDYFVTVDTCDQTSACSPMQDVITFSTPTGRVLTFTGLGTFPQAGTSAVVAFNQPAKTISIRDENGYLYNFTYTQYSSGPGYYGSGSTLTSIQSPSGVTWGISHPDSNTTTVTHTNGQSFSIARVSGSATYGSNEQINVTDPAGNVYVYQSTGPHTNFSNTANIGVIQSVTYPGSPTTTVSYKYLPDVTTGSGTQSYAQLSEVDYNGVAHDVTGYDSSHNANKTAMADGTNQLFIVYGSNATGRTATLTNPLGHVTVYQYNSAGLLVSITGQASAHCAASFAQNTYDANGFMASAKDNNGNTTTYTYGASGLLQQLTENPGTSQRVTHYVWDTSSNVPRYSTVTVDGYNETAYTYTPQGRLASVAKTNLSANGIANQTLTTTYAYTLYGSGLVQAVTATYPSPNGTQTLTRTYDALGRVTAVSNGLGQATSYSNYNALGLVGRVTGPNGDVVDYTYDARGRVITKTTYPNGTSAVWTYAYDVFGEPSSLTAPDGQITNWTRDARGWLATITHNDKEGTSTESFTYDANGDVIEHKVVRGSTVGLDEVYHYDELGRLYQKVGQNGQVLTYAYDGNGNVLSVANAAGHITSYQYDAFNRVISTSESGGASPPIPAAPTLNVPSSNTNGTYTVSWNSTTAATYYVLQEKVGSGSWATVQSSSAISWAASGKATNSYSYQVKACNITGCSAFSGVATVAVAIPVPPTSAPSLTAPGTNNTGSYSVSWSSISNATSYTLQEQVNGGSWTTVQSAASLSWNASGRATGTYGYRTQACNSAGCGPFSTTAQTVVTLPPAVAPTLSAPASDGSGAFTVSWSGVAGATSYNVIESINGGGWTTIQASGSTSWTSGTGTPTGSYDFEVQACNVAGCGPWSALSRVAETQPIAINGQTYTSTEIVPLNKSGQAIVGFQIVGSNSWQVYISFYTNGTGGHVFSRATGSVPTSAASVQTTWTFVGVPAGMADAGGNWNSPATSPVSLGTNPVTTYTTAYWPQTSPDRGRIYQLRIDFYNAIGVNISSSTATMIGETTGSP